MESCKGLFGKWFGHNYRAIYDLSEPVGELDLNGSKEFLLEAWEASRKKTYVHSICKRCGDIKAPNTKAAQAAKKEEPWQQ